MAQFIPTRKLPNEKPQFCYEAGGYALMRIVLHDGGYEVMTATATEDVTFTPIDISPNRRASSIFTKEDGTPAFPERPKPIPVTARVYPDRDRLIAAAHSALQLLGHSVEAMVDKKGRPYVRSVGVFEDRNVRSVCNRVAEALDFETMNQPWTAKEENQLVYEEFCIDETGEDWYAGDGMSFSKDGTISGS